MKIGSIKEQFDAFDRHIQRIWDVEIDGVEYWYRALLEQYDDDIPAYSELNSYAFPYNTALQVELYLPLSNDNPKADLEKFLKLAILQ